MKSKKNKKYSDGYKLSRNYLRDMMETAPFQIQIASLRAEYRIPKDGYELEIHKGQLVIPPSKWVESLTDGRINKKTYGGFQLEVQKITSDLALHHTVWPDPLEAYVFYNTLEEPRYGEKSLEDFNLCFLKDVLADRDLDKKIFKSNNKEVKKHLKQRRDAEDRDFPIELRISAYASERAILDYVRESYNQHILPIQQIYKRNDVHLGKSRTKSSSVQERKAFILQHTHLSHKKIASLVREKYNKPIDYTYVGKIIASAKKRSGGGGKNM